MPLQTLLIIISVSLCIGLFARGRWRSWVLLIASILVIFWLQPSTPIRHLDFWLPALSLALSILVWVVTVPEEGVKLSSNAISGLVVVITILLIGSTRYLGEVCCLTPTRPPELHQIAIYIALLTIASYLLARFAHNQAGWICASAILILGIFIILKSEYLLKIASQGLRSINSQPVELASGFDIRWIGFSYIAFRLLHTLIDRINGKLPILDLKEFIMYIIFYPSLSAGPIDRVQHFIQNLHQPYQLSQQKFILAGKRILIGIFTKYVLADSLSIFTLNSINASQVNSTAWLWVLLGAFAFRIFFDFSGYTDIAIGVGLLVGIQLPENFDKPYLKQSLTLFWNSWHMTLAGWFRSYIFNPLTRRMRSSPSNLPLPLIIIAGQLSTFVLIGLWHGITWNFAIWGAWHGLGLFIHNRWTALLRSKGSSLSNQSQIKPIVTFASTLLTFTYVSLGWVWFALPMPDKSWSTFLKLFGLR